VSARFLSAAQASDISILANSAECPESATILLGAASHIQRWAVAEPCWQFQYPPVSREYRDSIHCHAYQILCNAMAQVAREWWAAKGC
jgi:hypothetical protein